MTNYLDLEINHNYRKGYQDGFADGYAEAWVPVAEAKPRTNQKVIVYIDAVGFGIVDTATYRGGVFAGTKWKTDQESITHWMPEPGAPKKGEDDGAY